jgi:hypothetical protein
MSIGTQPSYSSNTTNTIQVPPVSSVFFDNRVVRCLERAGEAFCNLISSLWDKITSVISYFTGIKTLEDREIEQADNQLKEKFAVSCLDFVTKLNELKLSTETLKQMLTAVGDFRGNTFMHRVVCNAASLKPLRDALGDDATFIELLQVKNDVGNTPMHYAALNAASLQALKGMLDEKQFIELLQVEGQNGLTPLGCAVSAAEPLKALKGVLGKEEFIKQLQVKNNDGIMPMRYAISSTAPLQALKDVLGDDALVELLQAQDSHGNTLMQYIEKDVVDALGL